MEHEENNGKYVAAFMSSGIGLLTMAVVNMWTAVSDAFQKFVHNIGKLWIPGAQGIGPYSGKETFLLLAWGISWLVLMYALKNKKPDMKMWFGAFLVVLLAATLLLWPPVLEPIVHMIKG